MLTKIINPETVLVIRLAQDAEDLEACLSEIQDGEYPLIVQLGEGDRALLVTPVTYR